MRECFQTVIRIHTGILEVPNKITKLYAIENIATGEIIFNARGGAYKKPEEAIAKLDKLESGKYRLVTYELKGE